MRLVLGMTLLLCALVRAENESAAPSGYYRFPAIHGDTILITAEGDLWRAGIQGGVAERLTSHPGEESHAAFSPDGQTIFPGTSKNPMWWEGRIYFISDRDAKFMG